MAKKREPKPTAEEIINLATEYFLHGRGGGANEIKRKLLIYHGEAEMVDGMVQYLIKE